MKLRKLTMAILISVCFVTGAVAVQLPSKTPGSSVPPMAENGSYYVRLKKWDGPNAGMGSFTYDICTVTDDEVIQTITIERDVDVLRVESWQDILLNPGTYVSFEDADRDGADDLKILSENGGGQGELVYTTFLWDEGQGQFVEAVPKQGSTTWLWVGAASVIVAGGLFIWVKQKDRKKS